MNKVKLTYFKRSGKLLARGEYESEFATLYDVIDELTSMFRAGVNPGLADGDVTRNRFDTLIEFDDVLHLVSSDNIYR